MQIIAVPGSLRQHSSNKTLLEAAALLAPQGVDIVLYAGLGELPPFNPDLEGVEPPSVLEFRARLLAADGLLISSPEYAHGVPGVLKNALDWLVGSGELVDKPIALLNASPRATYAQASLMETLTVMTGYLVNEACIAVPLSGQPFTPESLAAHPDLAPLLQNALAAFARAASKAPRT